MVTKDNVNLNKRERAMVEKATAELNGKHATPTTVDSVEVEVPKVVPSLPNSGRRPP